MMEAVTDIVNALKKETSRGSNPLYLRVQSRIEESNYFWKSDYTIAVAKDNSKKKVANLMLLSSDNIEEPSFKVKREHDFWKKLEPHEAYKAVVEFSMFTDDISMPHIEKIGRDIMRSRKEVPTVGALAFIWVVRVSSLSNLDAIFQLYFKKNYITLSQEESKYYIGWCDKLKEMDMRNFVCDPALMY